MAPPLLPLPPKAFTYSSSQPLLGFVFFSCSIFDNTSQFKFKIGLATDMRTTRSSSPVAALALPLLLILCFFFHCATATARPLPATTVLLAHQAENDSVKAVAADLVVQDGATGNGEVSELMGAEEETCEEGNDECMQRRLLRDAHLDYIYTQHKKP